MRLQFRCFRQLAEPLGSTFNSNAILRPLRSQRSLHYLGCSFGGLVSEGSFDFGSQIRFLSTSAGSSDKSKGKVTKSNKNNSNSNGNSSGKTKIKSNNSNSLPEAISDEEDVVLDKRASDFENYVRELPSYLAEDPDIGEMVKQNQGRLGVAPRRKRHTMYKFVDKVLIEVRGGKGGNGCISIEDLGRGKRQPDGGNGGRGGNVYIVADNSLTSLNFDVFHFNGGHGGHGQGAGMTGKGGEDTYIKVPVGTVVKERFPDDKYPQIGEYAFDPWDESNSDEEGGEDALVTGNPPAPVIELDKHNDTLQVATGGAPGFGNKSAAGTANRRSRSLPRHKLPGQQGEVRWLLLELKLIADVGLVGFPNAGKSSLLRSLSNARPAVAPYPFTTLKPMVGIVEYSDMRRISVADIPGLIEGASENKGLGHDFLKHVERTKVLLYVIDAAATENRKPVDDFNCLIKEIEAYDPTLLEKPSIVFANKTDLKVKDKHMLELQAICDKLNWKLMSGSAEQSLNIGPLANELRYIIQSSAVKKAVDSDASFDDDESSEDNELLNDKAARGRRRTVR
jgi:GTP-binding protein